MFYIILFSGLTIDIVSKYIANTYLSGQINIIWDYVYLRFIENTWIAFSIQIPSILLKILTISLIIWIFYYYKVEKKKILEKTRLLDISFWLILAWAIWNAIERIFNEKVVDFIWVKYFSIFNLADSFITIWAILYIYVVTHPPSGTLKVTHPPRSSGTSLKPKGRLKNN